MHIFLNCMRLAFKVDLITSIYKKEQHKYLVKKAKNIQVILHLASK